MTMSKPFGLLKIQSFNSFFVFLSLLLFCFTISTTHAAENSQTTFSQQRSQIAKLTAELNQLLSQYKKASDDNKTNLEAQLISIAAERKSLLEQVVQTDPQTILAYALPRQVQASFPAKVQPALEQWVTAEGRLEIFFEDHDNAADSRLHYYLNQDGRHFALSMAGEHRHHLTTGNQVFVQGLLFNSDGEFDEPVVVLNSDQLMLAAGGSGDPVITSSPAILDNTIGEQRTAVFLVNFQDQPGDKPWTVDQANTRFFTEISQFYLENSYQQTWLTGSVLGWYTLGINSTDTCDQWALANAADAAAIADNVDLSQFDRYVYVFPKNTCSWSGFATVGGTQTRAWVRGDLFTKVPAHEMGHNFGLLHSHGLNCEGDAMDTNCVSLTYGDQLDTMGAQPGHFNAFQKERLGWLNQNQVPPIETVTQSGSYAIETYETNSANAKALKIFKDVDPVSGQNRWYYVELRQAIGEDQFISTDPYLVENNITNGVIVRAGTDVDGDSSFLLDMTPESTTLSSNFADLYDPALTSGSTYNDSSTGLSITTEYADSQTATVYVSYGGAPQVCSHNSPLITVSPVSSQWVAAGTPVNFNVTVTNQDSSACTSSTFAVVANVATGWTSSNPQLNLAPGETQNTSITVTSPANIADGFYNIDLVASNTDTTGYSASATVTYVVSTTTANTSPDAVDDAVIMANIAPIVINVLNNDSDPDGDAIYISAIGSASKGVVSINTDGSLLYTPGKRFKNSDSFTYTISDGQASATATVSLSLQSSSGGTTDGGTTKGKGGGKPAK